MTDWRVYLAWVMGLGLALTGPLLPLLSLKGRAGDLLLVVAPPWRQTLAVIDAAGGRPIGPGSAAFGQFATSDDVEFAARLRSSGAWLVLDGMAVATLCGWEIT